MRVDVYTVHSDGTRTLVKVVNYDDEPEKDLRESLDPNCRLLHDTFHRNNDDCAKAGCAF